MSFFKIKPRLLFFFALLLLVISTSIKAEKLFETITGNDINQFDFFKSHSINVGGWGAFGGTYETTNPDNHNNAPITFNDRTREFQLNQLNIFLQKSVDLESKSWNIGGRLDFMYGADSRFTQTQGWDAHLTHTNAPPHYDIAIPQAYLEIFAPLGRGVTLKLGHFYTIMGQEVVTAPNNFFYSHSYSMQYGEPFTHSGAQVSYALNDNFTLNTGVITGWDNFTELPVNWNYLGGLSWTDDEATNTISWTVISGNVNNTTIGNRSLSSLVVTYNFTNKFQYAFQHDFGYQSQTQLLNKNSYWYSVNQYLFYDLTDSVSAGLRAEWFRDNNGTRLNTGIPSNYFELTAGVNWKPREWFCIRPEFRYDQSSDNINPYVNQSKNHQFELAMDIILTI